MLLTSGTVTLSSHCWKVGLWILPFLTNSSAYSKILFRCLFLQEAFSACFHGTGISPAMVLVLLFAPRHQVRAIWCKGHAHIYWYAIWYECSIHIVYKYAILHLHCVYLYIFIKSVVYTLCMYVYITYIHCVQTHICSACIIYIYLAALCPSTAWYCADTHRMCAKYVNDWPSHHIVTGRGGNVICHPNQVCWEWIWF